MNILEKLQEKSTPLDNLDTTKINVVENNLLYITSVLERLDYVVSKTYGPFAGYVASQHTSARNKASIFEYTKDGMTTLANLNFMEDTDLIIANVVSMLTLEIKNKSGDGSTTAVKLLYNLVKHAAHAIRDNIPDIHKYRITTPKAIDLVTDLIIKYIDEKTQKSVSYEDLRDVGYIALNNDDYLAKPLDELIDHLKEQNVPVDEELSLFTTTGQSETTRLIKSPGYLLDLQNLSINDKIKELENVKFIMMPNMLDMTYLPFIEEMHKFGQTHGIKDSKGKPQKIIYIVSELDDHLKMFFKDTICAQWPQYGKELRYDIIELDYFYDQTKWKREDLAAMFNISEIVINEFLEKRKDIPEYQDANGNIIEGDEYDNKKTVNLLKLKMYPKEVVIGHDEEGNEIKAIERDHTTSRRELFQAFSKQLVNGLEGNISYRGDGTGLCVAVTPGQPIPEKYTSLLTDLKQMAQLEGQEVANIAKRRLVHLKDNFYIIEVAKRIADDQRIITAYRDAVKAINSSAKYGYHMGGSVGVYFAVIKAELELEKAIATLKQVDTASFTSSKEKRIHRQSLNVHETALFIVTRLRYAYNTIMTSLLPSGMNLPQGFSTGYINPKEYLFGDTVVISPVETDKEMIKSVMYVFSQFFSSLALEYNTFQSMFHIMNIEDNIKAILDPKPAEKEPTPVQPQIIYTQPPTMPIPPGYPAQPMVTPEPVVEEPVKEETEEERRAREEFEEYGRKLMAEMQRNSSPILGASPNVIPIGDVPKGPSPTIEKMIADLGPKAIGEGKVVVEGFSGDVSMTGALINRQREEADKKARELRAMLNSQIR